MVERGQRDVDHVDVGVVQHVLDASVGAHVGEIALDDVAAFLHRVADRGDRVEPRQLAQRRQVVQKPRAAKARDADAQGPAVDLRFVCLFHLLFSRIHSA